MTNKRLKLLIAILIIIIVFIFGYNQWHSEDFMTEMQELNVWTGDMCTTGQLSWQVDAWEDTKKKLAEQVDVLIGDYNISYTIVNECTTQVTNNYKKCIQDVVGVANAESTMFKRGMYPSNNWFGLMQRTKNGYKKRQFSSVEESIKYRVNLYVEKNREKRTTGQAWIDWRYCTSWCSWWIRNYTNAIIKLKDLA